jgi:AraC family transcriptional regulator
VLSNLHDNTKIRSRKTNPEIRELPDMTVYYSTARGSIIQDFTPAASKAFATLSRYVEKNRLQSQILFCLGITPDDPDVIPVDQLRYEAGFAFKAGINSPATKDVEIRSIPAGRYAVFLHQGPYDTLWQTWNAIYHDWLPCSGMTLRDELPFEVYLDDKTRIKEGNKLAEIYIPIK